MRYPSTVRSPTADQGPLPGRRLTRVKVTGTGRKQGVTVKLARSALRIPLALGEMAGVRETVMAAATYILRGGADAMAVSCDSARP
jgi:hypothetical protein